MSGLSTVEASADDIAAARRGDRAAREHLYRCVAPGVLRIVRRIVPRHVAEDVFQDSCMAMFERLGDFRGDAPFGAWVRAIAVNRSLMYLRSPWHRLRDWAIDSDDAASFARSGSDGLDVERLLGRLPPLPRAVIWLYEIEGYSHQEIAGAFGRSVSFSKSQLSRAHRRLRQAAALPRDADCAAEAPGLEVGK